MNIPATILQQVSVYNRFLLFEIGATSYKKLDENKTREGGLSFEFYNGKHIEEGQVLIELDWADEYRVIILDTEGKEIKKYTGVHFPELVSCLMYIQEGE